MGRDYESLNELTHPALPFEKGKRLK